MKYCPQCEAQITSADYEAGNCTQCGKKLTGKKKLSPHELIIQARARLETIRKCNGAMCSHCIEILCEDVFPIIDLAITRNQSEIEETRYNND